MNFQDRCLCIMAGLLGAAGVSLSAVAAHVASGNNASLATSANIMLLHAPAIIGIVVSPGYMTIPPRLLRLSGWIILIGVLLFSVDVSIRSFGYSKLFPFAAPSGGFLMIGGWILFSLVFLFSASGKTK